MLKIKTVAASLLAISLGLTSCATNARSIPVNKRAISAQVPHAEINNFVMALALTKRFYIKDVSDKKLFDQAIEGMLAKLDGHSTYMNSKALKELKESTHGQFSGIGIELSYNDGVIEVVSPIDGSPAFDAGIKSGDKIIQIDGRLVKDIELSEAIALIRGKKGTKVKLTILRKGEKKPLKIAVTRNDIKIQNVKSKILDKDYGYLRIAFFQGNVVNDVKKAMQKLQKEIGRASCRERV